LRQKRPYIPTCGTEAPYENTHHKRTPSVRELFWKLPNEQEHMEAIYRVTAPGDVPLIPLIIPHCSPSIFWRSLMLYNTCNIIYILHKNYTCYIPKFVIEIIILHRPPCISQRSLSRRMSQRWQLAWQWSERRRRQQGSRYPIFSNPSPAPILSHGGTGDISRSRDSLPHPPFPLRRRSSGCVSTPASCGRGRS
jgi:hypothetical protein